MEQVRVCDGRVPMQDPPQLLYACQREFIATLVGTKQGWGVHVLLLVLLQSLLPVHEDEPISRSEDRVEYRWAPESCQLVAHSLIL